MITEPLYWKTDLLRQSSALEKRRTQKRWSEASFARCEQTIFIGFYSVRKLIESKKLTNVVAASSFQIRSYPPTGKAVTFMNYHKVDELYDLDKPKEHSINLINLCHQFIHSYVFSLVFDEDDALSAVWVASDYQRSKALIEIPLATIIGIFETVASDDIRSMRGIFDPEKGDYLIENFPPDKEMQ